MTDPHPDSGANAGPSSPCCASPLGAILDSLPHGIFWKALDGTYLGCNRVFAEIAGLDHPDQIKGLTALDLNWPRALVEGYLADDEEVITQLRPKRHIVEPFQRADGTMLWIETTKVPLLDARGAVCGVIGHFEDITERKRVEEALRLSEDRLRVALEGANDGLWDVRMMSNEVYLSPRGCEILGYSPDELGEIAKVWQDLVHPDDLALTGERLRDHLEGRADLFEVEQRLRTKTGEWKWVLCRGKVVEWSQGHRPLRMAGTHTDISGRRQAEQEHRDLTAQLHQSQRLESLGSLAGGLAHDINNVLAAILSLASMHQDSLEPANPLRQALDTITSACLRGRDVVKGLLYFARKELQDFAPVDLNGLCRELAQLLGSTTLKRIRIGLDLQEPLGQVEGDAGALSHALMNLAVNALDAMPNGGDLEIRTRRPPGGLIELSVKDTGSGMTPEVLKRALEPFFTTKPVGQGSGLGLAMVYGTMQAHKGAIEVRSEPGLGTEVLLRFTALPEWAAAQPSDDAGAGAGAPARGLRFLLVDDDELIREAVPPLIEILGPEVLTAAGGLEALALLERGLEVDLVILDMNMPGLNGEQTLGRILALRPDQRVLLASGYTDQDTAGLVARNPTVDAISKPFTLDELRDKLAAFGMPAR